MNKYIYMFLILFGGSCSQSSSYVIYGVSYGGNCDINKMPRLVLDPDWTSEEADIIRESTNQWETKVNIDLGDLEYSDMDCGFPGSEFEVAGCIIKADDFENICWMLPDETGIDCIPTYESMILIFTKYTQSYHLSDTVAHEIGHWIGLGHKNENGYLMAVGNYKDAPYVTDKDVQFYYDQCKDL